MVSATGTYLSYERKVVSSTLLDVDDLTVPDTATLVELQAETQPIRYTMDNTTIPSQTLGLILPVKKKLHFLIEDLRRIKFVRGAGSDAVLNLHYISGNNAVG